MSSEKDQCIITISERRRIYLPMKAVKLLGIKDKVKLSITNGGIFIEPVNCPKAEACVLCNTTDDLVEINDGFFLCHSCGKKLLESHEWKKE